MGGEQEELLVKNPQLTRLEMFCSGPDVNSWKSKLKCSDVFQRSFRSNQVRLQETGV